MGVPESGGQSHARIMARPILCYLMMGSSLISMEQKTLEMGNPKGINTNLSYFTIRKIIGILGMAIPVLTSLVAWEYLCSISHSYYTRASPLFTGILILCGVFLMSYRGYKEPGERFSDNLITWIAGILITIVALVPTPFSETGKPCPEGFYLFCHSDKLLGLVHFGSASLFFVLMGYLSIFHFRRGPKDQEFSKGKKERNFVYLVCGITMWSVLFLSAILIFGFNASRGNNMIFWIELILLLFFGISWLVKGKALADMKAFFRVGKNV